MDARSLGLAIAIVGAGLLLIGLFVASGAVDWIGSLPGDLRFGGDHVRVYVPVASMLLISLLLTVLANVLRRLL